MRFISRIERLESRYLLAMYASDVSFGGGGVTDVRGQNSVEVQSDSKILATGSKRLTDSSGDTAGFQILQSRLNPDGTIDTSFGTNGTEDLTDQPLTIGARSFTFDRFLKDVDEIVVHNASGQLDTTFSDDGRLAVPFVNGRGLPVNEVRVGSITAAPEGGDKLFVLFTIEYKRPANHRVTDAELLKLNADGSTDISFGDNGILQLKGAQVRTIDSPQGIYAIDDIGRAPVVRRFKSNGKGIDSSFGGGDGAVTLLEFTDQIMLQPVTDKLIYRADIRVNTASHSTLQRLNVDGSLDTSFGENGVVDLFGPNQSASGSTIPFAFDDQNRIWVAAADRLFRLSADGDVDAAPFNGGIPFEEPGAMAFDAQGRLIAGRELNVTRYDFADRIEVGRDGVLYLTGDGPANDSASVTLENDGRLHARVNGSTKNVRARGIVGVNVRLFDGNNTVTVNTDVPATITAGNGNDTITTDDENDTIELREGSAIVNIGDGSDTVKATYPIGDDALGDVHQITGGDGKKIIDIDGGKNIVKLGTGDSNVFVRGEGSDQQVLIDNGSNVVRSSFSADVEIGIGGNGRNQIELGVVDNGLIYTGDGDDVVETYQNAKVQTRGGNDRIALNKGISNGLLTVDAGEGNDTIQVRLPNDEVTGTLRGGNDNDSIIGGAGSETIFGDGGNDTIRAGGGDDQIFGGSGRDRIFGDAGNDFINGGAHDDILHGNAGADEIDGGTGSDLLFGDEGDDLLYDLDGTRDQVFGGDGNDRAMRDGDFDIIDSVESLR